MKKALIYGFLGIAFAFSMVACNGSAKTEDSAADKTCDMMQAEEHECMRHCQMTCPDSVCLANNCENCACPEDSPCHKKACQGDGSCHKDAACAEKHECQHEGEGCCKKQGEGCQKQGEGCQKQGEGCQKQGEGCKKECGNHNK